MKRQIILFIFFVTVSLTSFGQTLFLDISSNNTCGLPYGSAVVYVYYGTPPYTYLWSTVPPQTTNYAHNLTAGTYYVTVTDSNSNTAIDSVIIFDSPEINCSICNIQDDTNGLGIGSMTACGSGGAGQLYYNWPTGQSGQTNVQLMEGTYCVTVSDAYCSCVTCGTINNYMTTSVNDVDGKLSVSVFPNPTSDKFSIDFSNSDKKDLSIELTNATGQIIYNTKMTPSSNRLFDIDISALPKSIYYLRIYNRQMILNKKILKE